MKKKPVSRKTTKPKSLAISNPAPRTALEKEFIAGRDPMVDWIIDALAGGTKRLKDIAKKLDNDVHATKAVILGNPDIFLVGKNNWITVKQRDPVQPARLGDLDRQRLELQAKCLKHLAEVTDVTLRKEEMKLTAQQRLEIASKQLEVSTVLLQQAQLLVCSAVPLGGQGKKDGKVQATGSNHFDAMNAAIARTEKGTK